MALTPTDIVTARLPALAVSASLAVYLGMAEDQTAPTTPTAWQTEDTRSQAVALMAMHLYTLDQTRPLGEAGAMLSKKEGELEVRFSDQGRSAKLAPLDPDLEQTAWGRQLLGLIKRRFIPVGVAGGPASAQDFDGGSWWGDPE